MKVKLTYFLLSYIFWGVTVSHAQNIFDYDHSLQYVNSLIDEKEYDLAYTELKRIEQAYHPQDSLYSTLVLKTLALSGKKMEFFQQFHTISDQSRSLSSDEMTWLATYSLLHDSFPLCKIILSHPATAFEDYHELLFCYYMLTQAYDSAAILLTASPEKLSDTAYYRELVWKAKSFKRKNKVLAIAMSAIIPASGKYYAKQPFDATVGLVITGIYGFLAIKSFAAYGPSSVFGWVNVSAFALFYLGNIWGTGTAVKRYNQSLQLTIGHDIKEKLQTLVTE